MSESNLADLAARMLVAAFDRCSGGTCPADRCQMPAVVGQEQGDGRGGSYGVDACRCLAHAAQRDLDSAYGDRVDGAAEIDALAVAVGADRIAAARAERDATFCDSVTP